MLLQMHRRLRKLTNDRQQRIRLANRFDKFAVLGHRMYTVVQVQRLSPEVRQGFACGILVTKHVHLRRWWRSVAEFVPGANAPQYPKKSKGRIRRALGLVASGTSASTTLCSSGAAYGSATSSCSHSHCQSTYRIRKMAFNCPQDTIEASTTIQQTSDYDNMHNRPLAMSNMQPSNESTHPTPSTTVGHQSW